jgi:hypothetical protein
MEKVLLFLGFIALLGTTTYLFGVHNNHHSISNTTLDLFNEWKSQFGKTYKSGEEAYRLSIFKENLDLINKFNAERSAIEGWTMGINQFMDLPREEFRKTYLNYIPPKEGEN